MIIKSFGFGEFNQSFLRGVTNIRGANQKKSENSSFSFALFFLIDLWYNIKGISINSF